MKELELFRNITMKKLMLALVASVIAALPAQAAQVELQLESILKNSLGNPDLLATYPSTATYTYDTVTGALVGSGSEVFINTTGAWSYDPGEPYNPSHLENLHAAAGGLFIHFIDDFSIAADGTASSSSYDCDGDMAFGRAVGTNMCTGVLGQTSPLVQYITDYSLNLGGGDSRTWDPSGGSYGLGGLQIDVIAGDYPKTYSFSVAPVPVPAAAWLFGSALCLLGWAKRKST
jgi:hypothetical protein